MEVGCAHSNQEGVKFCPKGVDFSVNFCVNFSFTHFGVFFHAPFGRFRAAWISVWIFYSRLWRIFFTRTKPKCFCTRVNFCVNFFGVRLLHIFQNKTHTFFSRKNSQQNSHPNSHPHSHPHSHPVPFRAPRRRNHAAVLGGGHKGGHWVRWVFRGSTAPM